MWTLLKDHVYNYQMSKVECIYQSFQGAGSIFLTSAPFLSAEALRQNGAKAVVIIRRDRRSNPEPLRIGSTPQLTIRTDNCQLSLAPLFQKTSKFINAHKKATNVVVWSPEGREMGIAFIFAHLILNYGYCLQYIWRLYDKKVKTISLPGTVILQLQKLSSLKSAEEEANPELYETVMGKRILRIRRGYSMLAKDSQYVTWQKRYEIPQLLGCDRSVSDAKEERQMLDSMPQIDFKNRSSETCASWTHRRNVSSFDF